MNFFTHIMISKTLHTYLSKEITLDKAAFRYGNIKPDLTSKCLRNPHTLENCLFLVCSHSNELLDQSLSVKEFSSDLGVICHYICDFFCYYHFDNSLHKKLLPHFIYEIRLQLALCRLMLDGKIELDRSRRKPANNIASTIMELRKDYAAGKKSLNSDIEFAFHAAARVCESIISKRSSSAVLDHPA